MVEDGTPSKAEASGSGASTPSRQRPKSAYVIGTEHQEPQHTEDKKKQRVTSPGRTLQPLDHSGEFEIEDDDEEKERGDVRERLSPEKDLALQTLDDVIQEAEDGMSKAEEK